MMGTEDPSDSTNDMRTRKHTPYVIKIPKVYKLEKYNYETAVILKLI